MLQPDRAEISLRSWNWRWMKLLLLLLVMRRLLLRMILRHDVISQKLKKLSDLNNAKKKPDKCLFYMVVRGLTRDTSSPKVVRVRNHVIPRPSVDMYIIPAHL